MSGESTGTSTFRWLHIHEEQHPFAQMLSLNNILRDRGRRNYCPASATSVESSLTPLPDPTYTRACDEYSIYRMHYMHNDVTDADLVWCQWNGLLNRATHRCVHPIGTMRRCSVKLHPQRLCVLCVANMHAITHTGRHGFALFFTTSGGQSRGILLTCTAAIDDTRGDRDIEEVPDASERIDQHRDVLTTRGGGLFPALLYSFAIYLA